MDLKFQIFGSKTSQDIDCMVFIDKIPEKPHISHILEEEFNLKIKEFLNTDKKVNSNLAVLSNGVLIDCFKGSWDETNNSLFYTYENHEQYFPNQITKLIKRDIDLKILRTARVLLSLISRTEFREIVKPALKGDLNDKIKALYEIDISNLSDLSSKNVNFEDFLKVYAFQIAQTLALIDDKEFYTKEELKIEYPELSSFIDRDINSDMKILEKYKNIFLNKIENMKLKSYIEYKYQQL